MRKLINVVTITAAICVAFSAKAVQAQNEVGHTLTVKVYQAGTWSGGFGEWIAAATVTLTKAGFASFPGQTQATNANGIATFTNVPAGSGYVITASKRGCGQNTRKYSMGKNNSNVNIDLECAPRGGSYPLTVKVLDVKGTQCGSSPQYASGATVRLKQGAAILQTATSNNAGSVVFQNVVAGTYTLSVTKNNCDPADVSYNMPGQNSETTVSLENCYTSLTYDIVAKLSSDPIRPLSGQNIRVALTITNNGPNGPSKPSTLTLRRYSLQGNDTFVNPQVSPNQIYKAVDPPKQLSELCKGESASFTFFDKAVPSGHYLYRVNYSPSINDANSNNHMADLMVSVISP